jgi:hypothetical protein
LVALEAVFDVVSAFTSRFGDWLGDLWDAFPDPLAMVEVTIAFGTGVVGDALGAISTVRWGMAARAVGKDCKGKLWTPENSILFIRDCMSNAVQFVTMTGEQTVLEFVTQKLGLFIYNTVKRFQTIKAILGLDSIESVIALLRKKFIYRVTLLTAVLALAMVALLIAIAGEVTATLVLLQSENAKKFCLPQDSKFVTTRHRHKRRRLNLGAGPDAPNPP